MWPTTSCSNEMLKVALVDLVQDGAGERQHLARERVHLLGDLDTGRARAHKWLVHVQVKQTHLRVARSAPWPARTRACELQQGHQGEARRQDCGHVAQQLDVVLGDAFGVPGADTETAHHTPTRASSEARSRGPLP